MLSPVECITTRISVDRPKRPSRFARRRRAADSLRELGYAAGRHQNRRCRYLPGHASEGMGFHIPHLSTLVVGALLPRADRPTRWDLPGGSLMDIIDSIKRMKRLNVSSLVPLQGPAIRGVEHVQDVLDRHLAFFEEAAENDGNPPSSWDRPAPTAVWLTPRTPWPLEEQESV